MRSAKKKGPWMFPVSQGKKGARHPFVPPFSKRGKRKFLVEKGHLRRPNPLKNQEYIREHLPRKGRGVLYSSNYLFYERTVFARKKKRGVSPYF